VKYQEWRENNIAHESRLDVTEYLVEDEGSNNHLSCASFKADLTTAQILYVK